LDTTGKEKLDKEGNECQEFPVEKGGSGGEKNGDRGKKVGSSLEEKTKEG